MPDPAFCGAREAGGPDATVGAGGGAGVVPGTFTPQRLNLLVILRAPKLLDSLRRCLCRYAGIPAPLFFNPRLCIT